MALPTLPRPQISCPPLRPISSNNLTGLTGFEQDANLDSPLKKFEAAEVGNRVCSRQRAFTRRVFPCLASADCLMQLHVGIGNTLV